MILILQICREKFHYLEFVKPIEDTLRKNNIEFETVEYKKLTKRKLTQSEKIIISGTSLKDNEFLTNIESILGYHDFRVSFEDEEGILSSWKYLNDSIQVLNNPPYISNDLDDINVGVEPALFNLSLYENDIEDDNRNLTWSVNETKIYDYIIYR